VHALSLVSGTLPPGAVVGLLTLEAAPTCEPLHRLTGHAADCIEVSVVVEDYGVVDLGNRCDQQVDGGRSTMLTSLGEGCLSAKCCALSAIVDGKILEAEQDVAECQVVVGPPRRDEQLEADGSAERELVDQAQPAI
jgi:hypothetical protein